MHSSREMADLARAILHADGARYRGSANPVFANVAGEILFALYDCPAPRPISYLRGRTGNAHVLLGRWVHALVGARILAAIAGPGGTGYALTEESRSKLAKVLSGIDEAPARSARAA